MGKSVRRTPIMGFTTSDSEKDFKRIEHRRRRAGERSGRDYTKAAYGPKDGKRWVHDPEPKWMRK